MRLLIESLRGISHERVESDQVLVRQPTAQIGTLAFGKAVYDQRRNLGLSVVDLTGRAGMAADEVECIEEGGTEPTIALLRRLAAPWTPTCT